MNEVERTQAEEALELLREEGFQILLNRDSPEEGITVEEALSLLKSIDDLQKTTEDANERLASSGQWTKMNGNYTLVGSTTDTLPPGYYDIASSNNQLWFVPVARRYDKIIRFPHAQVDKVIDEIDRFWGREEIFRKFKLSYKRGILMHGPPGSGKTSALQLIARDVVERGGVVLIFDADLFGSAYRQLRHVQPDIPVVVLMEDIDALLEGRNESAVLNILDGAESVRKVVFVATTNYPEKLGPRIWNRPSRFDRRVRVGHPDDVGRKMYLKSLIEGHENDLDVDVEAFVKQTKGMSLAHLKELFVATQIIGLSFDEAITHLKEMHKNRPTSSDDDLEFNEHDIGQYA